MIRSKLFVALWLVCCATPFVTAQAQTPTAALAADEPSALDGELFYQLLLGEINARSGEPAAAYPYLLDAARKSRDPRLYQRAVEVALQARSGESALQAARAWRQALPQSPEANRFVLQILIGLNRLAEAVEPLKRDVALSEPKERANAIANIPRYFSRTSNKKLAATAVEQALGDQLGQPLTGAAAWTTVGRMRMEAGDTPGALEAARRARTLGPQAEGPVALALMLMEAKVAQAEELVTAYLGNPLALPAVRLEYARVLTGSQRLSDATVQLRLLTQQQPEEAPAWLFLGTLELQAKQFDASEKALTRYVALADRQPANSAGNKPGLLQAYLALSQIAEQRGDLAQAQNWLDRIDNAQDLLRAQSRRASLLARQGQLEAGRQLIRDVAEKSPEDARLKLSAEVQLLRDNKQFQPAYDLLQQAVAKTPDDPDLLYDLAMVAEKLGLLDEMERVLRRLIAAQPDYHHAYNALGYSFAERNIRLPEARALILKSLEYAPDDPFITDSLGWVEFRSGNLAEALRLLQSAYTSKADPEIAAHLGEVLWVMGKREQAIAVWREGMQLKPDNETLLETLKRLRVTL